MSGRDAEPRNRIGHYDPVDYDIPDLPVGTAVRTDRAGLAFARNDEDDPFIRAENPVRVRR
ncbi:hypothetical protein ACNS7O_02875 [Haloferacaceae archaeon DSL9]